MAPPELRLVPRHPILYTSAPAGASSTAAPADRGPDGEARSAAPSRAAPTDGAPATGVPLDVPVDLPVDVPLEEAVGETAAPAGETPDVAPFTAQRMVEALLFAAPGPLDEATLARQLPAGSDVRAVLAALQAHYTGRGVTLVRVAGKWAFRTAEDLSWLLERQIAEERKLSKAALEMLAIIAYHQPVTRSEVEEIRGVATSRGTLDVLLATGWVRPRGRRRAPGRPVTYGTTEAFLAHFGLDTVRDLPGLSELKGAGLLDGNLPPGFTVPSPTDVAALMPDELPLDPDEDEDPVETLPLPDVD
jgi:segregation and condensation protein B